MMVFCIAIVELITYFKTIKITREHKISLLRLSMIEDQDKKREIDEDD